jgi:hypothetical protein
MLLLNEDDVRDLFENKVDCLGVAGAAAVAFVGGMMVTSMMAPKPQQMQQPQTSAFEEASIQRARKAADTSSSSAIKIAQTQARKSGPQASQTLLTSGGVADEELNLGGNLLAGG